MRRFALASMLATLVSACGGVIDDGGGRAPSPPTTRDPNPPPAVGEPAAPRPPAQPRAPREHDARFVGMWLVDQPTHALYEATYYTFEPGGALRTGSSMPAGCAAHLSQHCVTGSVANCVPTQTTRCEGTVSCVFGDEWYSAGPSTLYIVGRCSDAHPRDIRIDFKSEPNANTTRGVEIELVSVGGDARWSHDNWPWAFRKCPAGATEQTCQGG